MTANTSNTHRSVKRTRLWGSLYRSLSATLAAAGVLAAGSAACGPEGVPSANGSYQDDQDPSSPANVCASEANGFSATPLRRLSRDEYRNTISDLFAVTAPNEADLPEDGALGAFRSTGGQLLDAGQVEKYLEAASGIADRVLAANKLVCEPQSEVACVERFLDETGLRIFRRPLGEEEKTHYVGVFAKARGEGSFADAAGTMLTAMLLAPQFLYFIEPRPASVPEGQAYPVDDWQLATRLSYVFWHAPPDGELLEFARKGELHRTETLVAQAARLFASDRAKPIVADFLEQWLQIDAIRHVALDPAKEPALTSELLADFAQETAGFAQAAFWSSPDTLQSLLVSPTRYRNTRLSAFYNDSLGTTTDVVPVQGAVDAKSFGLFSQAGFLAAIGRSPDNAIIYRGRFVREHFLCGKLSPPQPGTVAPLPDIQPGTTNRQRIAEHTGGPTCQGCHRQMNPLGFTMEHFDPLGRWRDLDNGQPVDAQAVIEASDLGSVDGSLDLAQKLAQSADARECATARIFEYTLGRRPSPTDACAFDRLNTNPSRAFRDLFLAVAQNPAFLLRVEPK